MNVIDRLQTEILFFDGAMGTMLQSQGLEPVEIGRASCRERV